MLHRRKLLKRNNMTFSQISSKWTALILPTYKPSTRADIKSQLGKYLIPEFGALEMNEIGTELVQEFISRHSELSSYRLRSLIVTMRSIWRKARAWGYADPNAHPFEELVFPRPQHSRRRAFTIDEIKRILAASNEPYRTFFWIAAETGMRAGEICGLKWEDVNGREISVKRSVWNGQEQSPKSVAATRRFVTSVPLARNLNDRVGASANQSKGNDYFFRDHSGPWSPGRVLTKGLRPILAKLGIEGSLHSFRHANATMMDQINAPIKVRQARLGHASASTTMGAYTHAVSEDDRKIAEEIGRMLS